MSSRPLVRRARKALGRLRRSFRPPSEPEPFETSAKYWETRYQRGHDSGAGSRGRLARFKAGFLNDLVRRHGIRTVVELGCGDGRQLALSEYPQYCGIDVSRTAVEQCRQRFSTDPTKRFEVLGDLGPDERAELALSIDVAYHLVEDEVFDAHIRTLFSLGERLVVLYTSDGEPAINGPPRPHVRHRLVLDAVSRLAPEWELEEHCKPPFPYDPEDQETTFAEFFVFRRGSTEPGLDG